MAARLPKEKANPDSTDKTLHVEEPSGFNYGERWYSYGML